ncbi:MAG: accessory gene regulator B family protein [Bacillota bacterium]
MTLRQTATDLSFYLARQVDLPEKQVDSLRFGLEIIIGSLIKGILLFVLAWALDIVIPVVVALLVGSGFRSLAGGAHSTAYIRCLVLSLAIYLLTGWMATTYAFLISPDQLVNLLFIGFLFSLLAVLRWAPGPVPGKELNSSRHNQFKVLSLLYLFPWLGAMIYLASQGHSSLALAGLLALLAQGFGLTPMGYRLIERYDLLLSRNIGKGVATNVSQI